MPLFLVKKTINVCELVEAHSHEDAMTNIKYDLSTMLSNTLGAVGVDVQLQQYLEVDDVFFKDTQIIDVAAFGTLGDIKSASGYEDDTIIYSGTCEDVTLAEWYERNLIR